MMHRQPLLAVLRLDSLAFSSFTVATASSAEALVVAALLRRHDLLLGHGCGAV